MIQKYLVKTLLFFGLILLLLIWFKPNWFYLISADYDIQSFRNDYKDLINIVYVAGTLWLVILTRKALETNFNSQKALNDPMIDCNIIISQLKPTSEMNEIQTLKIQVLPDSNYIENAEGASVYLLIRNINGFGKATNLKITLVIDAGIPDKISINRHANIPFLLANQGIALYLYRFENPSIRNSLRIEKISITYSSPFDEASKILPREIVFDKENSIIANGEFINSITLGSGIKISP